MKKIISILLAVAMLSCALLMAGCGAAKTVKFGMGVYSYYEAGKNASEEADGEGGFVTNVAAVLVDADGKIVKCVIDCLDYTATWSLGGVANIMEDEIKSKNELGADYGMAAYGNDANGDGVVLEWNEQIAALCSVIEGKTIDEVKALVVNGYAGTEEVMTAGCTIGIADYIKAVEKAYANIADSNATANDTLKLGVVAVNDGAGATEEAEGNIEIEISIAAAATDADGKVNAISSDAVAGTVKFNLTGEATYDAAAEVKTKNELGTAYNMSAYGTDLNGDGKVLEWNEQADAFDAECLGKTASEISALVVDGYGVEALQTAGCTIAISDMVKAAVEAATIA